MAGPRDNAGRKPSLMRNLEGFFRGIAEGLEDDGDEQGRPQEVPAGTEAGGFRRGEVREVARRVQEARRGDFLLRRTTIDEVIYEPQAPASGSASGPAPDPQATNRNEPCQ